jgi:phosphatidate cytidylyltransferase
MSPVATRISLGAAMIAGGGAILLVDIPISRWAGWSLLPGFWLLSLGAMLLGAWEMLSMLRRSGRPCRPVLGMVFVGLLVVAALWQAPAGPGISGINKPLVHLAGDLAWKGLPHHLALFVAMIFAAFAWEIVRVERAANSMADGLAAVAWTMLVVLTVGLLGMFLICIRYMRARNDGAGDTVPGFEFFVLTLAVAKACDIGAYAVGSTLGRHKLVPRLSPKKTVEGLVGGIALGIGTAMAIGLGWFWFAWWQMLIFGAAVSVAGIMGDLAESLVKRACGVKDSGTIPGFGGVLDILDSILAAAPVAYVVLVILTGAVWGG